MLQNVNADDKDLKVISSVYWEETEAIKVNIISGYQSNEKSVRQGSVLSPDLYSLYIEIKFGRNQRLAANMNRRCKN